MAKVTFFFMKTIFNTPISPIEGLFGANHEIEEKGVGVSGIALNVWVFHR